MGGRDPADFVWADEHVERLKQLWAEGLSASECGARMGVSRNSVIGKIHRLGLSGKYRRPREGRRRMTKPKRDAASESRDLLDLQTAQNSATSPESRDAPPWKRDLSEEPRRGSFDLLQLRAGMCRWPEGNRAPYSFCGAPQAAQSSYCRKHYALAHSRGSQKDFDRAAEQGLAGKLFASRAGVDEAA